MNSDGIPFEVVASVFVLNTSAERCEYYLLGFCEFRAS